MPCYLPRSSSEIFLSSGSIIIIWYIKVSRDVGWNSLLIISVIEPHYFDLRSGTTLGKFVLSRRCKIVTPTSWTRSKRASVVYKYSLQTLERRTQTIDGRHIFHHLLLPWLTTTTAFMVCYLRVTVTRSLAKKTASKIFGYSVAVLISLGIYSIP